MSGLNKIAQARAKKTKESGSKPDFMHGPEKTEIISCFCAELERAKQRLQEKIELGDEKAVKKLREIIDNLNQTIERSK